MGSPVEVSCLTRYSHQVPFKRNADFPCFTWSPLKFVDSLGTSTHQCRRIVAHACGSLMMMRSSAYSRTIIEGEICDTLMVSGEIITAKRHGEKASLSHA